MSLVPASSRRASLLVASLLLATPGAALAAEPGQSVGALSLLAPLVAIGLAIVTRRVVPSLIAGVLVAVLVAMGGNPLAAATLLGTLVVESVGSWDHLRIALFTLMVAGAVGALTESEAMRAMVERIEGLARGRRGAMVVTWLSGGIIFFDDYANCLVVGNTMQSVVDRFRVSRAKLAYIVDATAAPVASLAVVSTWVAYQVSEIEKGLASASDGDAFAIFLASVPYSFYCWFTLAFVGAIAISGRDFGPMLAAERAALAAEHAVDERRSATSPWLAPITIGALVAVTFGVIVVGGARALGDQAANARLFEILAASDPYFAMLMGSAVALVLGAVLVVASGSLAGAALPRAVWGGMQPVFHALLILFLAWTLSGAIGQTGVGEYLEGVVRTSLDVRFLPAVAFLVAALTAFATGSSFTAMGILVPVVVGIAEALTGDPLSPIALGATASILSGACLGDHASPISDTTVLSSIGSGVELVEHVRTQLPYVLVVGVISLLVGYVPAAFGVPAILLLPVGAAVCFAVVYAVGREAQTA